LLKASRRLNTNSLRFISNSERIHQMPRSTIEPRTTTADESYKLAATSRRTKQRSPRGRYWFPLGFFDPRNLNPAEFATVTDQQPLLNRIADHIETLSRELAIPVTISGGMLSHGKRTLGFVVSYDAAIRQNIPAHREFTRRLKETFHCKTAGMDAENDIVWLWGIDPTAEIGAAPALPALGGSTNRDFGIMQG
jgi:hypothetical protein